MIIPKALRGRVPGPGHGQWLRTPRLRRPQPALVAMLRRGRRPDRRSSGRQGGRREGNQRHHQAQRHRHHLPDVLLRLGHQAGGLLQ